MISSDPASPSVDPGPAEMPSPEKRPCVPLSPLQSPTVASTSAEEHEYVAPPSPVPTEIIDIEPEDFVRTAAAHGVKMRDYATSPPDPPLPVIPEVWMDPFMTLLQHE